MMQPYIYMFVRNDLSHPQQIVQTAHAVDEIGKRHRSEDVRVSHMVLCGVKNEEGLYNISEHLKKHQIEHEMFWEPDIGECTAIATQPISGDTRKVMSNFSLKR